jgi:hypothetical protein
MVGNSSYLIRLQKLLVAAKSDAELFETIVNAPFHNRVRATQLDLGIVVLLLVDKKAKTINRVALSNTEQAVGAVKMSEKPFSDIKIPVDFEANLIARAIATGEPQTVTDWKYLFAPDLSPRAARFNQAGAGIEFSCVCPLEARNGGALIFSYYQVSKNIGPEHYAFMQNYGRLVEERLALRLGS